jgi:hypothetical protein
MQFLVLEPAEIRHLLSTAPIPWNYPHPRILDAMAFRIMLREPCANAMRARPGTKYQALPNLEKDLLACSPVQL